MNDIAKRAEWIRTQVDEALARCKRTDSVALMAVTKGQPFSAVQEALNAGLTLFGENRVQEMTQKYPFQRSGYVVHLIGHLQSNKARTAVQSADAIDSIDSLKIARLVSSEALHIGKRIPVLLEWNTSGEIAKSGFTKKEEYNELLDEAHHLEGIEIKGLMTIGPLHGDERETRSAFAHLRTIQEESRRMHPELSFDILSMGMSNDFVWGIYEGSTMVRIGTALFGERKQR